MSTLIDDGGPAFPCYEPGVSEHLGVGGVSVRDYFAIKALNGLLSYSYCNPSRGNYIENCSVDDAAAESYRYADAMLKARRQ